MVKTEKIILRGPKNKQAVCDIFIYEPENIEEASLGNLYIVGELTDEGDKSGHLVNLLSSLIKREYYCAPHKGPLDSLESSLKKVNITLNELANQGNLEWLGKLNFVCAALNKEQDLFLTQSGNAQAFLCREGQLASITKKLVPAPQKIHPNKTFQSIISGQVEKGDKIMLTTPNLFRFFNLEGLGELLSLPKIEFISDQMNRVLREQKKPPSLGTLFLEMTPDEDFFPAQDPDRQFITPPLSLEEILT